jgi:hypothetical protein
MAVAGGIVTVALLMMFVSALPTRDYDLSVDAIKDKQTLFINARVVVTNTGRLPLSNLLVDYGNKTEPVVPTLAPGEKLTFSPPDGVQLDSVSVTADPGIKIIQKYREPIKIPGMMGS